MKSRGLPILVMALAIVLALTWAVSAQGHASPSRPSKASLDRRLALPLESPTATATPTPTPTGTITPHPPATPTGTATPIPLPADAPVDVALIIDASSNQAADPPSMAAYNGHSELGCDLDGFAAIGQDYAANVNACVKACNDSQTCYPFQTVKDAAKAFIDRLRPGYDRVAVIAIDREPQVEYSLSQDFTAAKMSIDTMRVSDHQYFITAPGDPCPYYNIAGERWKCTTSNIGGAIQLAVSQLFTSTNTNIAILLATSSPAATNPFPSPDPDVAIFGFCPNKDSEPLCRDNQWATHNITTSANYDAEDYAWDETRYLGTAPGASFWSDLPNGGLGVRFYNIGLGKKVVCTGPVILYDPGPPVVCVPAAGPYIDPNTGYPNGAEQFLRHMADLGDDGDPTTEPCLGAPLGASCGNYYFAPNATSVYSDFQSIADRILVSANFRATPLEGMAPLTVTFTNQSLGAAFDWLWSFGDALTSTLLSPIHTYSTPGLFTVTLTATGLDSTSTVTRTNYIAVYAPVSAGFSAAPLTGTYPLSVTFSDQSSGDYSDLLWDFGDGITSVITHPTHIYMTAGPYTVTLSANGPGGMSILARTNYITVYTPVSADFSATPLTGTYPLTVTFTNQSSGDYSELLWNFGDGLTATVMNPTHTFSTRGAFTMTLTASGLGGTSTLTHSDYIMTYAPVHGAFAADPLSGTLPLTVTFTNQSSGDYTESLWHFGDGLTSTVSSPEHIYRSSGTYTVTLQVVGPGGMAQITRTELIQVAKPEWKCYLPLLLR